METEDTTLVVGADRHPARLTVPDSESSRGIVLVPGASAGPFGGIFDRLAREAGESGWHFLQYESWESHDDIEATDLSTFHDEIDAAADLLRERSCDRVFAVGKSFGGGLLLTHGLSIFEGAVLWAPAAYLGADSEGMVVLDSEGLSRISTPVALLQGTDDEVVDPDDARWIVDRLADAELVVIEGAGHSYRTDRHRDAVLEETMAFLRERR